VQRSAEGLAHKKHYSPSTERLYTSGFKTKICRNTRTEVLHEATQLEGVMRARMKLYDSTFESHARSVADGEEVFTSAAAASSTASSRRQVPSVAADVGSSSGYLRPRLPSTTPGSANQMPVAQVKYCDSPGHKQNPWTTSEAPPKPDDPDELADVWQPLMAGGRPWLASRDMEMHQLLVPGKTLKRTVDGAMVGGVVAENDERNIFYMTLNKATKPSSRSF